VTRPVSDAPPLVAALQARGIETFLSPMLNISIDVDAAPDLGGVQGLLFTSANGVRAFSALSPRRDLPAYAVGDRTATAAREAGFGSVISADGDVESLARTVMQSCKPTDGVLLHPAGSAVAGDLAGRLGAAGYVVRRAVLYHAHRATALSGEVQTALSDHEVDLVLFFSPRSAATFVTLAKAAGLEAACENLVALCLSEAVAAAADEIMWRRVLVAATPAQDALLATLDERMRAS
jgi:uroporphyrinogen-III synthase